MTLTEWADRILTNPILNWQDCNDLREAFHAGVFDETRLTQILRFSDNVDWVNSSHDLWQITADVCLNFLLSDDDASEAAGQVDWIEKQLGDAFEREFTKTIMPQELKTFILLQIDMYAQNILSTKLVNLINTVKV